MSYQNQPRGDRSNMVAAALLAVSAGACLGAVFSYGATPSSLYTAPATAVRVNSAAAQASVVPNMFNARMQRAAVADVYQADASDAQFSAHPQFATAAPTAPWVGAAAFGVLVSAVGAVVMMLRNRTAATHEEQYAMLAAAGKKEAKPWVMPKLEDALANDKVRQKAEAMSTQLPTFWEMRDMLAKVPKSQYAEVFDSLKGSTGTLLRAAETEEYYAMTWTSPKTQIYELPTGGAAEMDEGLNLMYFARKEQCLALGTQLRTKFKPRIENYAVYRVFPNGETQYLHPADGVFPEKVNAGRVGANQNPRSIGQNVNPAATKFTGSRNIDMQNERIALMAASGKKAAAEPFVTPTLSPSAEAEAKAKAQSTQLPIYWETRDMLSKVPKSKFGEVFDSFKGSTGTLLRAAETEEKYAITWTSPKEQIYELPTGGAAMMDEGENMMYFARKEQCLALGSQLRTAFKPRMEDFQIYRIFPNGEVQFLHPKDGVFPEKVNAGRAKANHNARSIGQNVNPVNVKFTGETPSMVDTEGPTAMYAASGKKAAPAEPWVEPTLAPSAEAEAKAAAQSTQLPIYWDTRDMLSKVPKSQYGEVFDSFKGSTGTLLRAAETEEKYAITWTSPKEQIYELPTGGAAMMDEGENMMYFARKEQCLALGSQLRTAFKPRMEDFKIYRIFPNGEVQFLHPKDGVFPEKVNEGRTKVNHNARNIGSNVDPVATKFSGTTPKEL